jgi:hypothetical protein
VWDNVPEVRAIEEGRVMLAYPILVGDTRIETQGHLLKWLRANYYSQFRRMHISGWRGCNTWEEMICKLGDLEGFAVRDAPPRNAPIMKTTPELTHQEFEQLFQIGNVWPEGIDAGSLISKSDKASLHDKGLVTPKYGKDFRLTADGLKVYHRFREVALRMVKT